MTTTSAHLAAALAAAPAEPTGSPVFLLTVAVVAIVVLLLLIIKVRLHAFFALTIVSALTALVAGVPVGELVTTLQGALGGTLGQVALLIGFGAVLGRLVEVSGGAKVLADTLLDRFGERHAPLALSVASLLYGFPIFLDAAFIVMLPIIYSVARRLGGSLLVYALPAAGAFLTMHALVPPHPGPVAASGLLGADVGLVVAISLLVGIPTWYVAGHRLGLVLARRTPAVAVPDLLGSADPDSDLPRPSFGVVLLVLLLPLVLIFANTGASTLAEAGVVDGDSAVVDVLTTVGATPVALLITTLLAMLLLVVLPHRGEVGARLEDLVDGAFAPVASIILITGAGGMFGGVLTATGIGAALADSLDALGLPVIVAGFLIAVALRVAQGSATVAGTTAAGLLSPAVAADPSLTGVALACVVVGTVAGAITFSHVNDSGFWLVGRFLGLDTATTLKTWTVQATAVGFMAFGLVLALYAVVS
ncbi:GntP family permease [uncultured Pseudokineococcus sp.]|uniref:GntP family permease n=1 Tax=uncultured Pseudokineococcus sp. TaxID=1642928 RepID=UPI0026199C07|nr:GntP family permease [uncultured Pseudokineococcus sp.]